MTVAVIGGLDRLNQHYAKLAEEENLDIKVYNRYSPGLGKRIAKTDGVILFTNLISHKAAREVYKLARDNRINLVCCHNCSISAARDCIAELKTGCRDGLRQGDARGRAGDRGSCSGCSGSCRCKGSPGN